MTSQKQNGSYYTPDFLSRFIMSYASSHFIDLEAISILEPSIGDGVFLKSFHNTEFHESVKSFNFTGIDKVNTELFKAEQVAISNPKNCTNYSFCNNDFLEIQKQLIPEYQFIVGNPPYISKKHLTDLQKKLCEEIHTNVNLPPNTVKNIWSAFLLRCCQLLTSNGILAFVLPSELLQVKFSKELRQFLANNFQRTEIFTFSELLFECKGQDTVLLFGFKKHAKPGQFFTFINDTNDLTTKNFNLTSNYALEINSTKWSHHILESEELEFIYKLASKLNFVNHFCVSKPGIVTAANSFFIVNDETINKYQLQDFSQPIIQKGYFVNGSIVFNEENFRNLSIKGKPVNVLIFNNENSLSLPSKVLEYLQLGVDLEIPNRYKCTKRKSWYHIPNISSIPEGFFFKRSHLYPKILKNNANTLVTDSAYKIQMHNGFEIDSFIYSFYNSLSLLFAELEGRYYGGGVLELTPKEFKRIPIPYFKIDSIKFQDFTKDFENKSDIGEILFLNDFEILNGALDINNDDINRIRLIYKKLIYKRLRINYPTLSKVKDMQTA